MDKYECAKALTMMKSHIHAAASAHITLSLFLSVFTETYKYIYIHILAAFRITFQRDVLQSFPVERVIFVLFEEK